MKRKRIYGTVFVLIICFIWGNSMISTEVSGAISHFIADILGGEGGSTAEGHFLLRKAAHFSEYTALGVTTLLFYGTLTADRMKKYLSAALTGISVPLIDETIQIFSGRGSAISDIWIDISGFVFGSALISLILYILSRRGKGKK
ncbi:MAG: VanZ family protein [Eubacteriales bacterium]